MRFARKDKVERMKTKAYIDFLKVLVDRTQVDITCNYVISLLQQQQQRGSGGTPPRILNFGFRYEAVDPYSRFGCCVEAKSMLFL